MIDIYATYTRDNPGKIKIQSVPAGNENGVRLLSPTTKGEIGNATSMDFSIQNGTPYYDIFIQMRTYIQVDYDGETIFYGRVLTINNGFYGEQKIHCEGAIAFLNDSYYPASKQNERNKISAHDYIEALLENHNDQIDEPLKSIYMGEVPGNYTSRTASEQRIPNEKREFGQNSWSNTKSALEDLKSHYGGAFRVRYENGKCYLDWLNHYFRSTVNNQIIEVGKNLLDISSATEISNIFTAIIPIGKTSTGDTAIYLNDYRTDIHADNYLKVSDICKSLNPASIYTDSELNSGYHRAEDYKTAIDKYGLIFKTVEFEEAHKQADLLTEAAKWIKNNYQGGVTTFTVKAVDLHLIGENVDKIMLGDRVRIKYPVGTNSTVSRIEDRILTCTSVQYDLFNPENNQYTFGIPANMLSKTYGDKSEKKKKQSSYNPPPDGGGDKEGEQSWISWVRNWFITHHIRKLSTRSTLEEGTGNDQPSDAKNAPDKYNSRIFGWFIEEVEEMEDGQTKYAIWKPRFTIHQDLNFQDIIWERNANGTPRLDPIIINKATLDSDGKLYNLIIQYRLIEYVKMEYGRDLTKGEDGVPFSMPALFEDEKTGTMVGYAKGAVSGVLQKVAELGISRITGSGNILQIQGFIQNNTGKTGLTTFGNDGSLQSMLVDTVTGMSKEVMNVSPGDSTNLFSLKSLTDGASNLMSQFNFGIDGKMSFTTTDEEGNEETIFEITKDDQDVKFLADDGTFESLRHLKFVTDTGENFRGTMVDTGLVSDTGEPIIYRFGQEIANDISDGATQDLVVAYVDGDDILIGSKYARSSISIARFVNGSWIEPARLVVNEDGSISTVYFANKAGTGAYVGYYDAWPPSPTYREFVDYSDYVKEHPSTKYGPHGEPLVSFTRSGLWDPKLGTFLGGLTTGTDSSGKVVSYLKADRVVIGTNPGQTEMSVIKALTDAHVIDSNQKPQGLVTSAVYANDMYGINAHFQTIESDYLQTINLEAEISNLTQVGVQRLFVQSAMTLQSGCQSITWNGATPGDSFSIARSDMKNTIKDISVASTNTSVIFKDYGNTNNFVISKSGNNLTFTDKDGNVMTFSKATTVSGSWSGGELPHTYTVLVTQNGEEVGSKTIGFNLGDDVLLQVNTNYRAEFTPTIVPGSGNKRIYAPIKVYTHEGSFDATRWQSDTISINAAPVYEAGQSAGYTSGWGAARSSVMGKTYTYGGKTYSYFPTASVAVDNRQDFIYVAVPNETVDGEINDTNRYKYSVTSDNNVAYIRYGSASGYVVAAVTHNKYNAGWGAARSSVSDKTYTTGGKTYNYFPASAVAAADRLNYIQVAKPNETVDGAIDDANRYRYYITSDNNVAYIRYGSASGYVVAAVTHNQYTTGYNTGWGAARSSVSDKTYTTGGKTYNYFPASAVAAADRLNYIQVAKPNETVDGAIDDTNRYRYYITSDNNVAYIRYGSATGYVVAAVTHNQYTTGYNTGWGAARSSVMSKTYTYDGKTYSYFPTASVAVDNRQDFIYVAVPNATVDGTINDTNRYKYSVTSDNNVAYIRYGSASGYVVAAVTHNKWNSGYDTAKGYISYPTTTGTGSTIQINGPKADRSGSEKYVTYGLMNSTDNPNNKMVLYTTVNGENVPVASFTHNKYTAGQKSITDSGIAAGTWYPIAGTDQTISAGTYCSGAQTFKGLKISNTLTAANIKSGVTIKIGDADNETRIRNVKGTYTGGGTSITWQNSKCYATSALTPQVQGDDGEMHTCERINPVGTRAALRITSETRSVRIVFKVGSTEYFYYMSVEPIGS